MKTLKIKNEYFEWGRIIGQVIDKEESKIESKMIAFNKYTLTPSPGRIFMDSLVMTQRDTNIKLLQYNLENCAFHFLKMHKV